MKDDEITFYNSYSNVTLDQVIRIMNHVHTAPAMGGKTTGPEYG